MPDLEAIPRPEHPRPDFMREPWINLNGRWRFTFDPENVGEQQRWYRLRHPSLSAGEGRPLHDPFGRTIVVPFPWESYLSEVRAPEYRGAAWYQRTIVVPAEWAEPGARTDGEAPLPPVTGDGSVPGPIPGLPPAQWRLRPYLCFGAVDWNARVWVDGRFVAEHSGGYTPFYLDLSRYVRPGRSATLTVRVWDACDADTLLGKQTYDWYTPSSGIWQTVWLEGRPAAYLSQVPITPHLDRGCATFALAVQSDGAAADYRLVIRPVDQAFPAVEEQIRVGPGRTEHAVEVSVPDPRPWSPEDPHLYECSVSLLSPSGEEDTVRTYFGLRSISRARWEDNPYEYVLLNEEPVYLRGVLDQAFHPDGLHTYPSDEAIRADVQAAKDLGLNMLRCHIKVNEPRYYHWADRLGLLVMYDLPSPSIYTPTARAHWESSLRDALERDCSHPSIFSWILFNETWGLEEHQTAAGWRWVREMYDLARELDPSRLIEDNSACLYDHVVTDLNTWHFYISGWDRARRETERIVKETYPGSAFNFVGGRYAHVEGAEGHRQDTAPLLNSEYGGLGARGGDKDIAYTFKFLTTELRRHGKVCGYVYTELTDIEWEHNGLLNYDRTPKEFGYEAFVPAMGVVDLTGADFVGLDCAPCRTLPPGSPFSAPVFVSHWDSRPLGTARLQWQIRLTDRFGETQAVDEGQRTVHPRRFAVTDAGRIEARLPDEPGLTTIAVWLMDESGSIRARNYVNVDLHGGPRPDLERTGKDLVLRFHPGDFLDSSWPQPALGPQSSKFGATGSGWVEYEVFLPGDVDPGRIRGLRLRFEAGARTAASRLGWKDPRHRAIGSYPQTETRKLGTRLAARVNGIPLGVVDLPDDPADARGVLSAHLSQSFEYASYGFLTTLAADTETTRRILDASHDSRLVVRLEVPRGETAGGLNLYGARMGAHPVDPMVLLDLE
jgi:glycosyl hydrolase family 2